ncbi:MFS transporter-like protein 164 [Elsinoe australis]|uniref:MFS transporter-like protein 164 n=1 Tax=Elsinoe australis TaxID=40998 RepID=A0A4U7ARA5_9PEZI|nr:MFS transporter-like protein 164 [Elsinoe australis]
MNVAKLNLSFTGQQVRAARVLAGCWLALFPAAGLLRSIGTLQTYLLQNDLQGYSESIISWIFGVFAYLYFFGGILVGPAFDRYGSRELLIIGTCGLVAALISTSFCSRYHEYFLAFGVLGGLASSFIWTTCVAVLGHWYDQHQALATGIMSTTAGIAGVVYPFVITELTPRVGFAWTVRVLGLLSLSCLCVSMLLIRTRLPKNTHARLTLDWRGFRDIRFTLTMIAIFILDWAILVPGAYMTTYAIAAGMSKDVADLLLPILNAATIFGAFVPGMIADSLGRFNVTIICALMCGILNIGIWLTAGSNAASMIAFAVLFGLFSGPGYSLTPVCVAQLCRPEDFASKFGAAYGIVSFATLFGVPISGLVLGTGDGHNYQALIIFCATAYFASAAVFIIARGISSGWSVKTVF